MDWSKHQRYIALAVLVLIVVLADATIRIPALLSSFFNQDGTTMTASASGEAQWLYEDSHSEDNGGLEIEKFGTPQNPKSVDILPLTNRNVSADGTRFTSLKDGEVISFDRTTVQGSVHITATDLTPLDTTHSLDSAHAEATFTGPSGELFKVVLRTLLPPNLPYQAFGGVTFDHLIHGETGLGTDKLPPVWAYEEIEGVADIYKDNTLIASDIYAYITLSSAAVSVLNKDKAAGRYNVEKPLGPLIIHLVVLPIKIHPDGKTEYGPVPTGVIGPDGKEQIFFHVNYSENVSVAGNRFLHRPY